MTTQPDFPDFRLIKNYIKRILPNSQAVALLLIILISLGLILTLSDLLMPVFASVVLAYLLDGLVEKLIKNKMPRLPAVYLVFSCFLALLGFFIFILMPMLSGQAIELVHHIPEIVIAPAAKGSRPHAWWAATRSRPFAAGRMRSISAIAKRPAASRPRRSRYVALWP